MAPTSRRSRCGPGCFSSLVALVLWLPQVARAAGLVALGRMPPTGGLVVTTGLLILSLLLPIGWRTWHHCRAARRER